MWHVSNHMSVPLSLDTHISHGSKYMDILSPEEGRFNIFDTGIMTFSLGTWNLERESYKTNTAHKNYYNFSSCNHNHTNVTAGACLQKFPRIRLGWNDKIESRPNLACCLHICGARMLLDLCFQINLNASRSISMPYSKG